MSLGKWTGMFSQGDDSLVPIPVFPSRVFRHSALYVKKGSGVDTLEKLRGKRVGDPDFAHTAGIYARGYLMHDVGLKLEEIEWVQAGTNKAVRHENLDINLPNVKRVSVPDKTLDDMLLAGEIDAILSAIPPKSFIAGNPNMVRLVPNYVEVEADYFRRTGIFPIMHCVAIKRPLLERHPWMAVNLYRAFEEAKDRSIARLRNMMISPTSRCRGIPTMRGARPEMFGQDFWPYGVAPNRTTLEAFLNFAFEQGVAHRKVTLDGSVSAERAAHPQVLRRRRGSVRQLPAPCAFVR